MLVNWIDDTLGGQYTIISFPLSSDWQLSKLIVKSGKIVHAGVTHVV